MAEQQLNIRLNAIDNASKALNNVKQEIVGLNKNTNNLSSSFFNFKTAIVAVLSSLVIREFVQANKEFDRLNRTLQAATGSVDKASQAYNYLNQLSKDSVFSTQDLTNAYATLVNSGVAPTTEQFKAFVDSAGKTTNAVGTLNDIVNIFAKATEGGLNLRAIDSLVLAGIPAWSALSSQIGVNRKNLDEFAKTSYGSNQILNVLTNTLKEFAAKSNIENTQDLGIQLKKIGDSFKDVLASASGGELTAGFANLANSIEKITENSKEGIEIIGKFFNFILTTVGKIAEIAFEVFGFINLIVQTLIKGFNFIFDKIYEQFKKVSDFVKKVFGKELDFINEKIDIGVDHVAGNYKKWKESVLGVKEYGKAIDDVNKKELKLPETQTTIKPEISLENTLNSVEKSLKTITEGFKEQFTDLAKFSTLIAGSLKEVFSGVSRSLAEAIVLGKKLNESFRELAQKILVNILQKLIEQLFYELAIEAINRIKIILKERENDAIDKTVSALQRQLVLENGIAAARALQASYGSGGGGSGFGGFIGNFAGGFLKGIFAEGGQVQAGQPYMVGERGRELFVPETKGTIVPNHDLGGGTNINFTINATDVRGVKELLLNNRATITNIVNQALNAKGKSNLV